VCRHWCMWSGYRFGSGFEAHRLKSVYALMMVPARNASLS
jgi:hypothetical protein